MSQVDTNPDRTIEDAYRELGVDRILRDYSAVPFVRRILFPFTAPVMQDPNNPNRVMTHQMEYRTADNGAIAYPRIMLDESGRLRDYGSEAFNEALRRRDYIRLPSVEMADQFTRLYKQYWKQVGYDPRDRATDQEKPQAQPTFDPYAIYRARHSGVEE